MANTIMNAHCLRGNEGIMITTGIKGSCSILADESTSAKTMGSGTLDVFATPAMAALMEKTAWQSIAPYLQEGQGSVGTRLDITHDAATPLGMTVTCKSELIQVDGRRLVFEVTASDDKEIIGRGTHERFIIDNDKFLTKTAAKLN